MSEDPMDAPPTDHGSDRFDYIELSPADAPAPPWLTPGWMPCPDCRANAFIKHAGSDSWQVTIAHDDGCPTLRAGT